VGGSSDRSGDLAGLEHPLAWRNRIPTALCKLKMQTIDSINVEQARELTGRQVLDERGQAVGTVDGLWIDPSSRRVAFLGVKAGWLLGNVHVIPAGEVQVTERSNSVVLGYPAAFIKKAPSFSPLGELAEVEKETVNTYFGRSTSLRRTSSIEEMRPEESIDSRDLTGEGEKNRGAKSEEGRDQLERNEQAFFNQKGFVTDSMPEVDASKELSRTQKETKLRNREDQIQSGSSD
jgi:sporulation protein YlmC with PRC-barrel domain